MANDAQMPDVRRWDYYPIEMPLTADGKGPATVGVDAVRITYEVWDRDLLSHASYDNLPDAINEAMRLNAALPSDPAADLCVSGQQVRALVEALRPFASEADMWGDLVPDDHAPLCVEMGHTDGRYYGSATKYTVGDLRRARTALTPAPQAEAQVREAAHRILELYDEALRWLLDPGVHDAHPDSKEMAELRRIVGAPAHRWTPSPDAPQTLTADQWRNSPARFAAHGITAAPDAATPTATDDPVKPWRMAFEAAARMAEQGILSMDGGQAATEIRSLAPDRVPATPTAQEAVPVAWIGRSGMIVDEPLRGFTPLYNHPPQPSETVAEAAIRALAECISDMEDAGINSPASAHAALRALKGLE